jgi:cytoskeletal protein CcmA (bactofilin family)
MFNAQNEKGGLKEVETIIGPSVKVKGNFHGQGNIVIEGMLEGSLKTQSGLVIGDKAKVSASVEAKEAKIGGEVIGNIKVGGYLEITATAKINGDIEASSLSIARGAILNGKCAMGASEKHIAREEKK